MAKHAVGPVIKESPAGTLFFGAACLLVGLVIAFVISARLNGSYLSPDDAYCRGWSEGYAASLFIAGQIGRPMNADLDQLAAACSAALREGATDFPTFRGPLLPG